MRAFHTRHSAIAAGVALLSSCNQPIALARGSQIVRDDPLNSERIEHLPPEVRNAVIHMCEDHPTARRSLFCDLLREFALDQAALRTSAM
jgi:hypothetical protein